MNKITSLTPKQLAKFPEYVKNWTAKGLNTTRQELSHAIITFTNFQKNVMQRENLAPVILLDSPLKCWMAVCMFSNSRNQIWDQVSNQVGIQVWNQVGIQVANQVESQVGTQVVNQVESQVSNQVGIQVWTQVRNQVGNQIWNQVSSQVRNQIWNQVESQVSSQVSSQVRNQIWNQVGIQVSSQVRNQIWNQVSNQVSNQVWNQVSSQVRNQVRNQVGIQVANQVESQVGTQVVNQVESQVESQVSSQVGIQVWSQVWNQVRNQVRNQVWNQVGIQVANQVESQVSSQVRNQVSSQVESQVWSQVRNQVGNQIWNQVGSQKIVYPHFDPQFWAGWFSFYEFVRNELEIKFTNERQYESFLACSPYSMVWPLENICIVCQPPTIIKKNNFGLHCEDGPALSYNGDNEIYALNGVVVPKELALTEAENLSIDFFKNEKNADVKAEFVRKYGIERMESEYGKSVDSYENYPDQNNYSFWWKSEYELIDMAKCFDNIPYQPYLKMKNFTTGIWHMEAVSPNCRNLKDAIKERFGGREMKIVAGA